jgi:hypothetical protein
MSNLEISQAALDCLSSELQVAQKAVALPHVQDIIRTLARFNLAVYMPHAHRQENDAGGRGVVALRTTMVAVEEGLVTRLIPCDEAIALEHSVPTAWRWITGEAQVRVASRCFYACNDDQHRKRGNTCRGSS